MYSHDALRVREQAVLCPPRWDSRPHQFHARLCAFWEPGYMAAVARQNPHSVRCQHVCMLELAGLLAGLPHMPMSEPFDLAWFVIPSRRCEPRGLSRSRSDAGSEGSLRRQPGGLTWLLGSGRALA